MSFSVGQPEQTGLDVLLQGLGQGIGGGLQQSLADFHQKRQTSAQGKRLEALGLPKELAGQDPQLIREVYKQQQKQSLIQKLLGGEQPQQEDQDLLTRTQKDMEIPGIERRGVPSKERIAALSLVDPSLARIQESQRKSEEKDVRVIKDRNLKLFDESSKLLKGLEEADIGLEQLQNLSSEIGDKQGEAFFSRLLRSFRFDPETGGFTKIGKITSTPEEERFVKLISDQTKNIKDDYGARVTNLDLQVFLRRFPDLMGTAEGRKQIIGTLRDYNEAKKLYNKVLKNEIRSKKGRVDPYQLDEIVESKLEEPLNKIKKRIRERGLSKGSEVGTKKLTSEIALGIFEEAKGNKEEARKLAKERGYEF